VNQIKITNIKEAGDIAPYEHRYRVEIKVMVNSHHRRRAEEEILRGS
jgi:hypothetical protein